MKRWWDRWWTPSLVPVYTMRSKVKARGSTSFFRIAVHTAYEVVPSSVSGNTSPDVTIRVDIKVWEKKYSFINNWSELLKSSMRIEVFYRKWMRDLLQVWCDVSTVPPIRVDAVHVPKSAGCPHEASSPSLKPYNLFNDSKENWKPSQVQRQDSQTNQIIIHPSQDSWMR